MSLAHLTVLPAGPLELIDAAASAGFDAIGLRIQPPLPTDTITPVVGNLPLLREIKSRLSQTGISIVDVEAFWLMPHTSVEGLRPAMEIAVELGARHVLIVGNDPDRARVIDRFAALCGMCAEFALRPMLEFIPYTFIRSLPEAHAFLAASGAVNSGILIDALHLSRSGGSPADIPQYPADLFSYVHLCDAPATPPAAEELRGEARGNRLVSRRRRVVAQGVHQGASGGHAGCRRDTFGAACPPLAGGPGRADHQVDERIVPKPR